MGFIYRLGIRYELREVEKDNLLEALESANHDPDVHGIIVYYPCFGAFPSFYGGTMDDFLRDSISIKKDVEVRYACFLGPFAKPVSIHLVHTAHISTFASLFVSCMLQGLCQFYRGNLYRNIRYVDDEKTQKCVLPCTPLAIVKILEHLGVYDKTYVQLSLIPSF